MDRYVQGSYGKVDLDSMLYVISVILFLLYLWHNLSDKRPLPPGPKPLPLIGNALQLPRKAPWETLHKWTAKYGPITSFKVGSRTVIVLGTREVIKDLLVKRSVRYSIRPRLFFLQDYLFKGMPAFLPHGGSNDILPVQRLLGRILHPQLSKETWKIQEMAAKHLLLAVSNSINSDIGQHLESFASHVTASLLYGLPIGSLSAEYHEDMNIIIHVMIKAVSIENVLIDLFPILQHIPGATAGCKKISHDLKGNIDRALNPLIEDALQRPSWSIVKELSASWPKRLNNDGSLQMTVLELELAGRATTGITIGIMVTAAALHPQEMEIVYAEMDRVVGNSRMPNFTDTANLTYLQAFIKESTRLRNIVPFGVPHAVTQEDEYMGFRIPPDAIILPNQWGLNMDSTVFPKPDAFLPERWILNPDLPAPSMFGFGKRACPGKNVANGSMLIAMASLVWAFRFEAKEGLNDTPDMDTSMVFKPKTSKIGVSYRTHQHRAIIEREWKTTNPDVSSVLNKIGDQLGPSEVSGHA